MVPWSATGMRGLAAGVALLLAVSAACWQDTNALSGGLPAKRELQATASGCSFTGSSVVSDAWVSQHGWALVTPAAAMDCFNQVQIGADFARESLVNLGKIYNSSYVFTSIAANPPLNAPVIPCNYGVFNYSVNLAAELNALADAIPASATSTNFGDLQFAVNEIFNRLHDAHVLYFGGTEDMRGTMFGNALSTLTGTGAGSNHAYLASPTTGNFLFSLDVQQAVNGTIVVSGGFLLAADATVAWVTFASINGKSPMEYLIQLANHPSISIGLKPTGSRVNNLLGQISRLALNSMGRLTTLPNANVTLVGGRQLQLVWGVTMPPSINASTLALVQQQANVPGVPLMALLKAANVFLYENTTVVAQASAPLPEPLSAAVDPRRRLQSSVPSVTNLVGTNGTIHGFYYFNGTKAVMKLTSFSFQPSVAKTMFTGFFDAAQKKGASELVLDLIKNGGGTIVSGIYLALGLFPQATYGDFGITYDRIMGQDAVYAYANGIHPDIVNATVFSLVNNNTWLQARVAQINSNATDFKRLALETNLTLEAITVLFASASAGQAQICKNVFTGALVSCNKLWQPVLSQLQGIVANILNNQLTADGLQNITSQVLPQLLQAFWPYIGLTSNDNVDPYANPTQRVRGGQLRNYTATFDMSGLSPQTGFNDVYTQLPSTTTPFFSKILALSDGSCGSTCDTFSRTSYFYSMRNPTAPVFKFVTYGGTGNISDSSGTAFPGGNVNDQDYMTASWAYYATLSLLADWVNLPDLGNRADAWAELLPVFPAFLDNLTPRYTQSEIYQVGTLGNNSLPMEYYHIPGDYYIPGWFQNTGLPSSGQPSDLPVLYNLALQVLDAMPGPKSA